MIVILGVASITEAFLAVAFRQLNVIGAEATVGRAVVASAIICVDYIAVFA